MDSVNKTHSPRVFVMSVDTQSEQRTQSQSVCLCFHLVKTHFQNVRLCFRSVKGPGPQRVKLCFHSEKTHSTAVNVQLKYTKAGDAL